ncbi:unnamed protein product [Dibothriocephalus latus]|uniref:Uncharacterized protein n=1 Tax=Dibothriocephalus latus TaxID=60516 RepID=A0A3P7RGE9_DIBLA|nr:unnamed protein product [Dibothriocephalus latus]
MSAGPQNRQTKVHFYSLELRWRTPLQNDLSVFFCSKDVTGYLLQKSPEQLEVDELLPGDRTSKDTSLGLILEQPSQLINLLVRIPKSGAFYKLYLYAVPKEADLLGSIPLIFTYLIEAPLRMTAAETPYIGFQVPKSPSSPLLRYMLAFILIRNKRVRLYFLLYQITY